MAHQDDALSLIGGIYDAALRPELWDSALEAISDNLIGAGFNIPFIDSANNARYFLGMTRLDPDCGERFLNNPIYVEPSSNRWMTGLTTSPVGTIVYREQIWTDREYQMSPIFNDIIRPQKLWHWAFAPLILERDVFIPMGVLRTAETPLFDRQSADLMSSLLPHLVRALQVSLRLDILRTRAETAEALIDRLSIGVILVDEAGGVIQVNKAANAVLCIGDGLTAYRGHLNTRSSDQTKALRRLIGNAAQTSQGIGSQSGGAMSVSRPSEKRPLAVLVAPLRTEDTIFEMPHVCAIVFVSDPEQEPRLPLDALSDLYHLTPQQTALVRRLAAGDTLDAAGEELGITRNTARTHLRLIFDKTGVRSQTQLARLLGIAVSLP
jgi:DNA-binding CsgD family transcriptional regulator/PAS domain-containing protein